MLIFVFFLMICSKNTVSVIYVIPKLVAYNNDFIRPKDSKTF